MVRRFEFDVAVSFADEDRDYVSQVVRALHRQDVRVFYDADHQVQLWGEDLVTYLDGVYRHRSRFVVIFISYSYVHKQWTRYELRSALARAIREKRAYVLPARFDDSDVPGMPDTVLHIDCQRMSPDEVAEIVCRKLALSMAHAPDVGTAGEQGASRL